MTDESERICRYRRWFCVSVGFSFFSQHETRTTSENKMAMHSINLCIHPSLVQLDEDDDDDDDDDDVDAYLFRLMSLYK